MSQKDRWPAAGRFRHVVFPDAGREARRPVNYAPAGAFREASTADPFLAAPSREMAFLCWLFASAGLDASKYKAESLLRRLPACLRAIRATSVSQARAYLGDNPRLRRVAVSTLVIGVTQFFRDEAVFATVVDMVVPELASRMGPSRRLRVWSAACSDGAELYSVAMVLDEAGLLDRCELLGTDCRADAVERARAGVYDPEAVRGLSPGRLARHFVADGRHWRVAPRLGAAATWRTGNVLAVREPGPWDLVLCRNLLIYLTPAAAGEAWRQLEAAVRPGGVLVTGKAERPVPLGRFAPVAPAVYCRTGAGASGGTDAA